MKRPGSSRELVDGKNSDRRRDLAHQGNGYVERTLIDEEETWLIKGLVGGKNSDR